VPWCAHGGCARRLSSSAAPASTGSELRSVVGTSTPANNIYPGLLQAAISPGPGHERQQALWTSYIGERAGQPLQWFKVIFYGKPGT